MYRLGRCYKGDLNPFLFLLVFFLAVRDILGGLGQPVFVYLLIIFLIPLFLLLRDVVTHRLDKKTICFIIFLTIFYVAIIPYNEKAITYFLPMVFAGYAFRYIDYRQISWSFAVAQFFVILLRFYLSHIGLIVEESYSLDYKADIGSLQYDLGYGNANTAGMVFFFFFVSLYIALHDKNKWLSFVLIAVGALAAYSYTASRTSFFMCLMLLITYVVPGGVLKKAMYNRVILLLIPTLVLMPLLFFDVILSSYQFIDELLSRRIYFTYLLMGIFNSPFTYLTGIEIEEDWPIDNVFCYMLVTYGLISILVFYYRYIYIVKKRERMPLFVFCAILVMIVSGLGEASWAAFGKLGSSFFWIMLFNETLIYDVRRKSIR